MYGVPVEFGVITPLPTLGGTNSTFGGINNKGEAVGIAENSQRDPECPAEMALNGTGPQVLDFEAVVWGPGKNQIRQLSPLPGDTVGIACGINDIGQVVGFPAGAETPYFPGSPPGRTPCSGKATAPSMISATWAAQRIRRCWRWEMALWRSITAVRWLVSRPCPATQPSTPSCGPKRKGIQDLGVLPGDLVGAGLGH